jgi:hypothetical protein
MMFSMWSMHKLYKENQWDMVSHKSHERVKYGHGSHRTRNQEWLYWRGPAAIYLTQPRVVLQLPESWDSKIWSQVLWDSEPRNVLARAGSNLPDQKNKVMGPTGHRTKNKCADKGQQQFTRQRDRQDSGVRGSWQQQSDPLSCQRTSLTSKHISGLETNKNMGQDGAWN